MKRNMTRHNPILTLLADGRIDVAEAERLLEDSASSRNCSRDSWLAWLPVLAMAAIVLLQNSGTIANAFDLFTIRAVELARLEHFHLFLIR